MSNTIDITMRLNGLASVSQGISAITRGFSGMSAAVGSIIAPLLAAATAAISLHKIAAGLKEIVEFGSHLDDLSARVGTSVRQLVIQGQAFDDAGIGADGLALSYAKLQNVLEVAFREGGAAAENFRRIGLSVGELINLDPGTQFERVAKAIGSLPSPTQRTAAAMAIFGRGAAELIPLFRNGGAFDEAKESLGDLPELMQRNARTLDGLGDAFGRIPNKIRGLFAGVVDQLDVPIKELTKKINAIQLTELGAKIGGFVQVAIDAWTDGKLPAFISLTIAAGFEQGIKLGKLALDINAEDIFQGLISGFVTGLFTALKNVQGAMFDFWRHTIVLMLDMVEQFTTSMQKAFNWMFGFSNAGIEDANHEFFRGIQEGANDSADSMKETFGGLWDKAIANWKAFMGTDNPTGPMPATEELAKLIAEANAKRGLGGGGGVDMTIGATAKFKDPKNDIGEQMRLMLTKLDEQMGTIAQKIARAFKSVIGSAIDGIAGSIEGLLRKTMSWGDAIRNIGSSLIVGVIQAFSRMAAEFLVQHIVMDNVSRIFAVKRVIEMDAETAYFASLKGAEVGTHVAAEGAKTGATGIGAVGRGAIRVGETIWHGVQVAFRTGAHIAGELLMTAVTLAMAPIRIAATIAQVIPNIILAATEAMAAVASIPYVGPFLAVAALGLVLGAGYKALAGMADGGMTPGRPTMVMVGERGPELVLPAHVTAMLSPVQRSAMVAGNFSSVGTAKPGRATRMRDIRNIIVADERRALDMERDRNFENMVVRIGRKNRWRFEQ